MDSFLDKLRGGQNAIAEEQKRRTDQSAQREVDEMTRKKTRDNFDNQIDTFVERYREWAKNPTNASLSGSSVRSMDDRALRNRVKDMVYRGAETSGVQKKSDGTFDEADIAAYGTQLLSDMNKKIDTKDSATFDQYRNSLSAREKQDVSEYEKFLDRYRDNKSIDVKNAAKREFQDNESLKNGIRLSTRGYADWAKKQKDSNFDIFERFEEYSSAAPSNSDQPAQGGEVETKITDTATTGGNTSAPATETDTEEITYTYKPGDNFGQVLLNLGLSSANNLWGPNGDVAYYTKQLNDQGIYGNIPTGRTIRLRRRK